MKNHILDLKESNFWGKKPKDLGLIRHEYLQFLKKALKSNLILVLTGQRRVGKSYILRQFIAQLINEMQVEPRNILYINLENFAYRDIKNVEALETLIQVYLQEIKPNKRKEIFLLIDEIQEVLGWETLLNSYLANSKLKTKIIITGSNSNLLSSELSTYITGRFIAKEVFAFSYSNYLEYFLKSSSKEELDTFLSRSQLPETFLLEEDHLIQTYINDLRDSILLKDIIKRYKVENIDLLERLFLFLVDNIGNLFSINSIVEKFKSQGYSTNTNTISNYLKYFQYAYLFHAAERFDIKGKKILEGEKKYYLNDLGFKRYLFSSYAASYGKTLENYVYNLLIQADYKTYVGKINNVEVDFVAEKPNARKYIQVAYLLADEEVVVREYKSLELIDDNWEKLVVSMDQVILPVRNGIKHVQAWNLHEYLT